MNIKEKIKTIALKNAIKYDGNAKKGSVVGGLLGDHPELKKEMGTISSQIDSILEDVNALSLDEQKARLQELEPSFFEESDEDESLFDRYDIEKPVTTCFPPAPEKYAHIGHAYAAYINYKLAQEYDGTFILRFEDTNPAKVSEEYYTAMKEDLNWLGVKWDDVTYASDYMDLFLDKAKEGIEQGHFYMCNTSREKIREMRKNGKENPCSQRGKNENLKLWNKFVNGNLPEFSLRAHIGMDHENSAMRDPVLFRYVADNEHPRHSDKHNVWPTYDFQNSVLDGEQDITYRFRSKEFEMRDELHSHLQRLMGYTPSTIFEFARFEIEDAITSGRRIREKIREGDFTGWDDHRLVTLRGLKRRGIQPEALTTFLHSRGISKTESTCKWNDLVVENRRFLDDKARRYYMIQTPQTIQVKDLPRHEFSLDSHPNTDDGARRFTIEDQIYIEEDDYETLEEGKVYRLKGCCNVTYDGEAFIFDSEALDRYKEDGEAAFHFLPVERNREGTIIVDDESRHIVIENNIDDVDEGEVIQFERFGFARLDDETQLIFIFTH